MLFKAWRRGVGLVFCNNSPSGEASDGDTASAGEKVGTRDGRVKVFGREGVEHTFPAFSRCDTQFLTFLLNKAALLRIAQAYPYPFSGRSPVFFPAHSKGNERLCAVKPMKAVLNSLLLRCIGLVSSQSVKKEGSRHVLCSIAKLTFRVEKCEVTTRLDSGRVVG